MMNVRRPAVLFERPWIDIGSKQVSFPSREPVLSTPSLPHNAESADISQLALSPTFQ